MEDEITKCIQKYDENEYEKKIKNNLDEKKLYYLSNHSQNILNWYDFHESEKILEIGGQYGQLTSMLCSKANNVTTIEPDEKKAKLIAERCKNYNNLKIVSSNLIEANLTEKFDVILLIGFTRYVRELFGNEIKLKEIISLVEKYLNNNGKIIIAVDNKFGLKYFAGNTESILNKQYKSLVGYSDEDRKIETYTKNKLEDIFKKLGFNYNFYYPLPDYKMPNVIFTDLEKPRYNSIDKYSPYINKDTYITFNEIDVFREILKNNPEMFTFFANSFLIEISKNELNQKYKYISYNNLRKEEYRLITKISEEYVEKQKVSKKTEKHYENIKNNLEILKQQDIKILEYIEDETIRSKYVSQNLLLNNILTDALENAEYDKFYEILNKYINVLKKNTYKESDFSKTVFAKYNLKIKDPKIIESMNFLENGLWDMTFKNCFYIDDEFIFFDQEWKEEKLPYEYILYRSIIYTIALRRYLNIDKLLEKYDLIKYKDLFEKLDNKIQKEIRDESIWEYYSENKYININETINEMNNMKVRDESKEKAIENLNKEKMILKRNIEELSKINEQLQNKLSNKIKIKIKKIIGGKDD